MIALEPGAAGAFMQRARPGHRRRPSAGRRRSSRSRRTRRARRRCCSPARSTRRSTTSAASTEAAARCATTRPARRRSPTRVRGLLASAGIAAHRVDRRRPRPRHLDRPALHATRRPTSRCCRWPSCPTPAPAQQFALGAALAPLADEGVLIARQRQHHAQPAPRLRRRPARADRTQPEIPESAAFRDWFAERSAARDWDALFAYRTPRAARRRHAPDRRAPAALVRRRRRRRPRGRAGARCTTA